MASVMARQERKLGATSGSGGTGVHSSYSVSGRARYERCGWSLPNLQDKCGGHKYDKGYEDEHGLVCLYPQPRLKFSDNVPKLCLQFGVLFLQAG